MERGDTDARVRKLRTWCSLAIAVAVTAANGPGAPASAQDMRLDPSDPAWVLRGEAEVGEADGVPALLLRSGTAIRPDVSFEDGTIEFEFRPTDRRAFLGVVFRAQDDGTGEDVYLRLHKSGLADAIQYTPDYGGRGQWQIYHGPDATAPARFRAGEWQRVRIEVAGSQAAVFVGGAAEPQLVADRLRAGVERGALAFWGNQPGASGDDPLTAAVRGIVVRPGVTTWEFEPAPVEEALPGVIAEWGVAGPFAREGDDVLDLPPEIDWRTVEVAPNGARSRQAVTTNTTAKALTQYRRLAGKIAVAAKITASRMSRGSSTSLRTATISMMTAAEARTARATVTERLRRFGWSCPALVDGSGLPFQAAGDLV